MISVDVNKKLQSNDGEMNLTIQLSIQKGELVTLYGDSGAGKTSTLRILSGLLNPDSGKVEVNNDVWFDSNRKINLKPQKRRIGYVFQDYALFPNMTVYENLRFASGKHHNKKVIDDLIEMVELSELQNRKPFTLSGGQQQRVALARALVQQPDILLLDEPLAALDHKIRLKLQDYILAIHGEFNLTTLLISHDVGEVVKLSNRVFVMDSGQIIKTGTPQEVFVNKQISGKFSFTGEVLDIQQQDVVYIVIVLIQNNLVKVIAEPSVAETLSIGDKVMVASKAFNPIIYRIKN